MGISVIGATTSVDLAAPPGALQKIADISIDTNAVITLGAAGRYAIKYIGSSPYAGVHNLRQEKRSSLLREGSWATFRVDGANEKISVGAILERDIAVPSTNATTGFFSMTIRQTPNITLGMSPACASYSSVHNIYLIGGQAGQILTSTDGLSWTTRTSPFPGGEQIRNFVESPTGTIVAYTNGGTLGYSTNGGVSWTLVTVPGGAFAMFGGVWGGGRFVIVGSDGRNINSTDGITWTNGTTAPNARTMSDVAYNNGTWVAPISFTANPPIVYQSTNGSTWTQRSISETGSSTFTGQVCVYNNQFFVSISNFIYSSPDGINWFGKAGLTAGQKNMSTGFGQIINPDTGSAARFYINDPDSDIVLYRTDIQAIPYGQEIGWNIICFGPDRLIYATNTTACAVMYRRPLTGRVLVYRVD